MKSGLRQLNCDTLIKMFKFSILTIHANQDQSGQIHVIKGQSGGVSP